MSTVSKGTKLILGLAAALLAGVSSYGTVRADDTKAARPGPAAERLTQETVLVTGIDRDARTVTLQNAQGEKGTVNVPPTVKAFDKLKVGDRIDIDYFEAVAVSLMPPGAKPTISERSTAGRMGEGGGAAMGRETTISAEVTHVDVAANKVSFKGPKGNVRTVTVSEPAMQQKLAGLKPGQVVQFTYTEAVAAAIRPAVSAK
jgi:Cu/Ag efflux protein CusF